MFLPIIFLYQAHSAITDPQSAIPFILPLHLLRLRRPTRPTRYAIRKAGAKTLPRKVRNVLIQKKGKAWQVTRQRPSPQPLQRKPR
jgi:hypothetical protein